MRSLNLVGKKKQAILASHGQINVRHLVTLYGPMKENALKKTREALLISKAELARAAEVSPITITRIEKGLPCRMETKRRIILALGLKVSDKDKLFKD